MKTISSLILGVMLISGNLLAQVGINNDDSQPDPSAILDVKSNTKGLLIPRMTTTERNSIVSPAAYLIIMNTTTRCLEAYNELSTSWETIHCFTCPTPAAPLAGSHVSSETQIVWNWNTVSEATGYKWSTSNDYDSAIEMGIALTKTETGLNCNTACTRYVWAYNSCGVSASTTLNQSTTSCGGTCGLPFTDTRDGKIYNTVLVGTQCWMAQNMNYEIGNSWCYDDTIINCNTYGRLYDWWSAHYACPSGWHLPSDYEWTILTDYLDSQPSYQCNSNPGWICKALAATTLWESSTVDCAIGNNPSLNNATGFSALPGGLREYNVSDFGYVGLYGYYWTSTEYYDWHAWNRIFLYDNPQFYRDAYNENFGFSARCVRDN